MIILFSMEIQTWDSYDWDFKGFCLLKSKNILLMHILDIKKHTHDFNWINMYNE